MFKSQELKDFLVAANIKHLLKYIEHKHQLLTFGFCRENVKMIDDLLPDPIINICLIYAFLITKYFKYDVGNLQISDDRRTATRQYFR